MNNILSTTTLDEIIEEEGRLARVAADKYPRVNEFALRGLRIVGSNSFTIARTHYVLAATLAAVRKHIVLAYLSAVRRHRQQCALTLRLTLEYTALACFALGNPNIEDVLGVENLVDLSQEDNVKKRAYAWLAKHHPHENGELFKAKRNIDRLEAHAGLGGTISLFDWDRIEEEQFHASFFDEGEIDFVPASLWQVGNFSMGIMMTVATLNRSYAALTFRPGFLRDLSDLGAFDTVITAEMKAAGMWGAPPF